MLATWFRTGPKRVGTMQPRGDRAPLRRARFGHHRGHRPARRASPCTPCRSTTASGTASSWRPPGAWPGRWACVRHVVLAVDLRPVRRQRPDRRDRRAQGPQRRADVAGDPVTYVPARNTVLLSLALAYAEVVGAADIFLGVNAVDYSGYPDCRPEFIAAFARLANLATKAGVEGPPAFRNPHAAGPPDQGPDHPPRHGAGRRLRPDPYLLRSRRRGHRAAAAATPASCG